MRYGNPRHPQNLYSIIAPHALTIFLLVVCWKTDNGNRPTLFMIRNIMSSLVTCLSFWSRFVWTSRHYRKQRNSLVGRAWNYYCLLLTSSNNTMRKSRKIYNYEVVHILALRPSYKVSYLRSASQRALCDICFALVTMRLENTSFQYYVSISISILFLFITK